jgi:hypothetical protein
LKPRLAKKLSIPIPIELILVVGGTLISSHFDLDSNWSVKLVGEIPKGLPAPEMPDLSLFKSLLLDGFGIAIVSYSASVSMALILAEKHHYEIDFNQELLAMVSIKDYFKEIDINFNTISIGNQQYCWLIFFLYANLSFLMQIGDSGKSWW